MIKNTKPGAGGAGLLKSSFLAGMSCEYNTAQLAIKKIQQHRSCSNAVAALISSLAGLGPRELRS